MPEEILLENERRQSRAEVASYLRSVADKLDAGEPVTFTVGDESVTLDIPDQPTFEVKVERETARDAETGEMSVEFELEWPEDSTAGGGDLTID